MAKARTRFHFDWRWLVIIVIVVAALMAAIIINNKSTDYSAYKILNTMAIDNSDTKINWDRYQTVDISLENSFNISESGTYHITGSLNEGQITIDAGVGEVRLILDNVSITNPTGPAILCYNAENFVINLVGENYLTDGATYDTSYDADITSVIYSKADLAFGGTGSLTIDATYQDGIVGKDDVKFSSGNYHITSNNNAIRGKDSVYVVNGNFNITSIGNAFKSNNETDYGKGFILVENGNFYITTSAKGFNSNNSILIQHGNFNINSYDDALHSNNYLGIVDGDIVINSGDDGIHADRELIVDGGNLDITKSYEGLEAQVITINGGDINIVSTDDGINAGGGADQSSLNRSGANPFNANENCILTINNGNIYVNAAGDGIDSNGYLIFNGGQVVVDGPVNNGNGALDAGVKIDYQGGQVLAVGSSGMAEDLGNNSGICNLSVFFPTTRPSGTKITIKDTDDNIILEHTSAKSFSHLSAGSEAFFPGGIYTIYLDDEFYDSFMIAQVTTTLGNKNQDFAP